MTTERSDPVGSPLTSAADRGPLRVALVHDNFEGPTGMGRVGERLAHAALDEGWRVTIVGSRVPPALRDRCDVRLVPMYPRTPALPQHLLWCAGAARALGDVRADVVHVHSPFLMRRADLITCHFLAGPAHARGVRETRRGIEGGLRRGQEGVTRMLDDRLYRRRPERIHFSFVSEFLRDEFADRYGTPRGGWVLAPTAPAWRPIRAAERARARRRLGCGDALVVGYLGGVDPRKGLPHVLGLADVEGLFPLIAGYGTEVLRPRRGRALGFVDTDALLEACDIVVGPAAFDSAPVAILHALARGLPVVVTPTTGWAKAVARHGAGVVWDGREPLATAVRAAAPGRRDACRAVIAEFDGEAQRAVLRTAYGAVSGARRSARLAPDRSA